MPRKKSRQGTVLRQRIAAEAGRLMAEHAIEDYLTAKHKALQRLGLPASTDLPTNSEIQRALQDYQALFYSDTQPALIQDMRQHALQAMQLFERWRPRLVGSLVSGTAGPDSAIQLHLFADSVEDVAIFLANQNIPAAETQHPFRMQGDQRIQVPGFEFLARDHRVNLTVFPVDAIRQAPLSPVDGRPMKRLSRHQLEMLLATADTGSANAADQDSAIAHF